MANGRSPSRVAALRIPLVPLATLPATLREHHADCPGRDTDLVLLMMQAPTMQPGIDAALTAMMMDIRVPPVDRQLCVLAVAHLSRADHGWAEAVRIARHMGIAEAKLAAIADDRFGGAAFSAREAALLAFTRQVVATVRVDDMIFGQIRRFYDARQLVELVHIIGLNMLIARVAEVAQLADVPASS